jgi:hypothetical protein
LLGVGIYVVRSIRNERKFSSTPHGTQRIA